MKSTGYLKESSDGLLLEVWVQPGAKRSEIAGLYGERLKIKVAAPPEKGRANQELIRFLSSLLGCSSKEIELIAGASARAKTVLLKLPRENTRNKIESLLPH